jgi:hypothetical protein
LVFNKFGQFLDQLADYDLLNYVLIRAALLSDGAKCSVFRRTTAIPLCPEMSSYSTPKFPTGPIFYMVRNVWDECFFLNPLFIFNVT